MESDRGEATATPSYAELQAENEQLRELVLQHAVAFAGVDFEPLTVEDLAGRGRNGLARRVGGLGLQP